MLVENLKPDSIYTCFFDIDITINTSLINNIKSSHQYTTHKLVFKETSFPYDASNQNNINCYGSQPGFELNVEVYPISEKDIENYQEKIQNFATVASLLIMILIFNSVNELNAF